MDSAWSTLKTTSGMATSSEFGGSGLGQLGVPGVGGRDRPAAPSGNRADEPRFAGAGVLCPQSASQGDRGPGDHGCGEDPPRGVAACAARFVGARLADRPSYVERTASRTAVRVDGHCLPPKHFLQKIFWEEVKIK